MQADDDLDDRQPAAPTAGLDAPPGGRLAALLAQRQDERFRLHQTYINPKLAEMLKTIGFDVHFVRGQGPFLFDRDGARYLDLLSGFGVFALGRNHPRLVEALGEVLHAELAGLVQLDCSPLAGLLAEKLVSLTPGAEGVFFCNSGTEAVEAAIKFSRMATGREAIVYCDHAFHGLTYGALSLNGEAIFRQGFGPLLPGCRSIPFDDLDALERALHGKDVAAFVVEPIQGKGVSLPADDYLAEAARLCRRHGTLFVVDEIQTGLGRTGKLFAVEHWGVEPDMLLMAKALSGGFVPVGAVAAKRWILDRVFNRMDRAVVHGSTFAKNDLAMAAGLATLEVLVEEDLVAHAARLGEALLRDLEAVVARRAYAKSVRGKGLMIGLELGAPRSLARRPMWLLMDRASKGLFCQCVLIPLMKRHRVLCQVGGYGSYVIKMLPPLVIGEDERRWIVEGFDAALADCEHTTGAVWDLARTLAGNAMKAEAGAS